MKFLLMLGSVEDVTTRIIASLTQVEFILGLKGEPAEHAGAAVLNLFTKAQTQKDDRLTSILLFLLSQLKVRNAVAPLFKYLFSRKRPNLNREFAGQALLKAAGVEL